MINSKKESPSFFYLQWHRSDTRSTILLLLVTCTSALCPSVSQNLQHELMKIIRIYVKGMCYFIVFLMWRLKFCSTLTCFCRSLMYSTAKSNISAVLVCCQERSIKSSKCTRKSFNQQCDIYLWDLNLLHQELTLLLTQNLKTINLWNLTFISYSTFLSI